MALTANQIRDLMGLGFSPYQANYLSGLFAAAVPGGSTTQLQYNNNGAFGGIPGSSWDGTFFNVPNLTIGGINGAQPQLILSPDASAIVVTRQDSAGATLSWYGSKFVGRSDGVLGFWNGLSFFTGAVDTALTRSAAGIMNLGNGAAADLSGSLKLTDLFTNNTTFLIRAGVALANGAAAQTATLTNAPAAGNPTKWISIDDAGTTRKIPAW